MTAASAGVERTSFRGPHGPVEAVQVRPSSAGRAPAPAVLILHEGLGLTAHTVELARRFAQEGYLAFAPNLYSHDVVHRTFTEAEVARGVGLLRAPDRDEVVARLPADEQERLKAVFAWFSDRDTSTYLPDARAAAAHLAGRFDVRPGGIAAVGFSLGGGLVGQLAVAGVELAAGAVFYGQAPPLDQVTSVRFPLQVHYAEEDPAITPKARAVQEAFRAAGRELISFVYPGTRHGFFNETRPAYHADAAQLSWRRTREFFAERIGGGVAAQLRPYAVAGEGVRAAG
ncbi:dienelactone hydrolase family protein [Sorangium sp. So ce296]|uniref:dienelactone hydrolase family protein n=1 Tax=Sorangium sp. So ce296 TaxID=3133296 RepID=UPI003F632BFD